MTEGVLPTVLRATADEMQAMFTRAEGIAHHGGRGASHLRQQLVELQSAGKVHVVIDCSQIGFIDSTGLGVLLGR